MLPVLAYLMRFFDLILGALTAAPHRLAPVMKIPLRMVKRVACAVCEEYQAAPITENVMEIAIPA